MNFSENAPPSLDSSFWNARWQNSETGWDIGYASPAITAYMEQYLNKQAAILIPGCGNAYEAEYLVQNNFTNITLLDIAPKAVEQLKEKFAATPQVRVLCGDFFQHQEKYDLMVEQTFFCAITPNLRTSYAKQAASLLNKKGKIMGLLFNTDFEKQGPPFGGNTQEYEEIFNPFFLVKKMETCYNSIKPRSGSELFVILEKRL
ncbi:MAG: methyltransferase domain-containing protein [Bacteroidetes bacterium]|nr:methyltransferase domain-containing protein [Bacteroidota bacterium]